MRKLDNVYGPERKFFEQSLAQYRARVYEASYGAFRKQETTMENVVEARYEKPTVLIIEDNTDEWFLIRYGLLRKFPEVDCIWLPDVAQAFAYLDKCLQTDKALPRMIVLDLYVPRADDGLRVLKNLKADSAYGKIPVVVFSRSNDPKDIAQAFAHSATAYVVKPVEQSQWRSVFDEFKPYWTVIKTITN